MHCPLVIIADTRTRVEENTNDINIPGPSTPHCGDSQSLPTLQRESWQLRDDHTEAKHNRHKNSGTVKSTMVRL